MIKNVEEWTRTDIDQVERKRGEMELEILRRYSATTLDEALVRSGISEQTVVVYAFAGAGTRWEKSWQKLKPKDIDKDKPRCLAPVENLLTDIGVKGNTVPIGMYNYYAGVGLGKHLIIHGNYIDEIIRDIVAPLGGNIKSFEQAKCERIGKVAGHGDAMVQALPFWKDSRYVIYLQSNDVYSRRNLILSLFTMHFLDMEESGVGHVLPVQFVEKANYPPVIVSGVPIDTYQAKLRGIEPPPFRGLSNIGERLYVTQALLAEIDGIMARTREEGSYRWLNPSNGNDEFALDHVDIRFMQNYRARLSSVCHPEEWSAAKEIDRIPVFMAAQRAVYAKDGLSMVKR